jgi:hypothetical protein
MQPPGVLTELGTFGLHLILSTLGQIDSVGKEEPDLLHDRNEYPADE